MTKFAHDEIVPDQQSDLEKKEQVANMFNSIAYRYDFLNRFLSVGIDVQWRKKAIRQLKSIAPKKVLDVAVTHLKNLDGKEEIITVFPFGKF